MGKTPLKSLLTGIISTSILVTGCAGNIRDPVVYDAHPAKAIVTPTPGYGFGYSYGYVPYYPGNFSGYFYHDGFREHRDRSDFHHDGFNHARPDMSHQNFQNPRSHDHMTQHRR